jgi:two-component system phosphate regulon sensor histidine kinase PhoR
LEFEILGDKHRYCVGRITRQPATKGLLLVIHDMTALRQLETVRRDFVANVSHELRTPVSVIQANVETLLDGALDDPAAAREFTEGIDRSTQRLALLLDDLLDLAKLEARGVELRADAIDAHTAAQSVVDFLTPKAHEKKQTLELKVPDGLRLRADPLALEQILINLIDNALKYTPAGGTIVVHASLQPDTVRFEVRDNGRGIAPDMRERVFERFFRVDPGRAAHMGGTGLGLSIVKHFVTQMKGVIGVEPRTGGGSTFFFELPRDATPPTVTPS